MLARKEDPRDRSQKAHPQSEARNSARFKAALKITNKYSPGHKDRTHDTHNSGKR